MLPIWEEAVEKHRKAIRDAIPEDYRLSTEHIERYAAHPIEALSPETNIFSGRELMIIKTPARQLVQQMSNSELSSEEVTKAFCRAAAVAQQLLNCCLDIFFDDAVRDAKAADRYLATNSKPIGPLHGLPISIKDQANIMGRVTCMGYVGWLNDVAKDDSIVVKCLRHAGAILYVKTSAPTTLICPETVNNVVGQTVNAYNRDWTCGGSSGGEGALVGFYGSPLGVGSDIGGSVRIPAAMQNLYSLRPSSGRIPTTGMRSSLEGQDSIKSVVGPLAHTIDDVEFWMESMLATEPWKLDPRVLPKTWNIHPVRSFKFGILRSDGLIQPLPPVSRAIKEASTALQKAGHQIVEFNFGGLQAASDMLLRYFGADGDQGIQKELDLSGEQLPKIVENYNRVRSKSMLVNDLWKQNIRRLKWETELLAAWQSHGIDGVITPVAPFPAPPHGKFFSCSYTFWINLADLPTCTVPVTWADANKDFAETDFRPCSEQDLKCHDNCKPHIEGISRFNIALDDPKTFHGSPVALQIVGPRFKDEMVVAMSRALATALEKT